MTVVPFPSALYEAKLFKAHGWKVAGTLCGCIDIATPESGTYTMTPDEVQALIVALMSSRADVLANSRPFSDPRLYDGDAQS